MEKCERCQEEVEMLTGRNKYFNVDISNSNQYEELCLEIHVKKCPNCNKLEVYDN